MFYTHHYVYLHLLLCLIILSTSWVGFQLSASGGNTVEVKAIFSIRFLILLLDLFLVICYFIIVRGAEISNYSDGGKMHALPPDVRNEKWWALIIFIAYLIWDIFTKYLLPKFEPNENSDSVLPQSNFEKYLPSSIGVIFCSIICWISQNKEDACYTTLLDITLICLFILFRGLKQKPKKEDNNKKKTKAGIDVVKYYKRKEVYIPALAFLVCLILMILKH